MKKRTLQLLPIPTWLAVVLSIAAFGLWVPSLDGSVEWYYPTAAVICTLANAILSMVMFYEVGITRTVSATPAMFYLLTIGAVRPLHCSIIPHLVTMSVLIVLLILIKTKSKQKPIQPLFGSTLLCLLMAWLCPDTIILLPLTWISFTLVGGFSLRALSASLIAIALTAVYYCLYWFLAKGYIPHFIDFNVLFSRQWIGPNAIGYLTMGAGLFMFTSIIGNTTTYTFENTSTIRFLNLLIGPSLLILLCCLFPCKIGSSPLCTLLGLLSISMTAFALLRANLTRSIIIGLYILGLLVYWGFNSNIITISL